MIDRPLWQPDARRILQTRMADFMQRAGCRDWDRLHRWSVERSAEFWNLVWDFCGVKGEKGNRTLLHGERMPGAQWFPDSRLNFAENLLFGRADDAGEAIVFWGEDRIKRRLLRRQRPNQISPELKLTPPRGGHAAHARCRSRCRSRCRLPDGAERPASAHPRTTMPEQAHAPGQHPPQAVMERSLPQETSF